MATQRVGSPPLQIDEVKNTIHCVLCSNQGSISMEQFAKDYHTLGGSHLPYRQLGFQSVEELLKSMPDVAKLSQYNGTWLVKAVPKDSSAHIADLVNGQKKAKRVTKRSTTTNNNIKPYQQYKQKKAPHFNVANNTRQVQWNLYRVPAIRQEAPVHEFKQWLPAPQQQQQAAQPQKNAPVHNFRPMLPAEPPQQEQAKRNEQLPQQNKQQQQQLPKQQPKQVSFAQPSFIPPASPNSQQIFGYDKASALQDNNRNKLARFVKLHNLGEISYTSSRIKKAGEWVATVSFANSNIKGQCYPETFKTEEEAFERAAQEALADLEAWYEASVINLPITKDEHVIAQRVISLVGKKPKGFWSGALPKIYADEYREKLPADWIKQVQRATDELEFEPVKQSEHYIIYSSKRKTPSPLPLVPEEVAVPDPVPSLVSYTDSDIWMIHVQVILPGSKIGIRRIECEQSTAWAELMDEMDLYYSANVGTMKRPLELKTGILYAATIDSTWYRVSVITQDDEKATVSLVDYVDREEIASANIYPLEARFAEIPCQGLVCQLHGLSIFSDSATAVATEIEYLLNKEFTAQVVSREPEISLILVDESGDRDVYMNEWILEHCLGQAPPTPLKRGAIVQTCVVSYVSPGNEIYLLRDTPQQNAVDALVSLVAKRVTEEDAIGHSLTVGKLYLGISEKRGWCRMRLLCNSPMSDGKFVVQLIDFGDTEAVAKKTLVDLAALSPILAKLPDQAVKVVLNKVPPEGKVLNEKANEVLRKFIPVEVKILARINDFNSDSLPVVDLLQRLSESQIVSINETILFNESIFKPIEEPRPTTPRRLSVGTKNGDMLQRFGSMSLGSRQIDGEETTAIVPEADIPPVKDNDSNEKRVIVKVLNASNPHHFYVQLSSQALSALTKRMQELCVDEEDAVESVIVGGFYATLHGKSESYRRVQVIRQLGADCQVVHVDYGDVDVVAASNLKPLHPDLAKLPAQAIRAKLHGVKPNDGDWSPLDAFFFQKAVGDKELNANIVEVMPDSKTVAVKLFESIDGDEMSIAKLLIDNSHASSA